MTPLDCYTQRVLCYVTGHECTCGAFDVAGDCPNDYYVHEDMDDTDDYEDMETQIDAAYKAQTREDFDDYTGRL